MTDDLTEAEKAFRALLTRPKAYRAWADGVRAEWAKRKAK